MPKLAPQKSMPKLAPKKSMPKLAKKTLKKNFFLGVFDTPEAFFLHLKCSNLEL
jgi:hypothetical protein